VAVRTVAAVKETASDGAAAAVGVVTRGKLRNSRQ
jgi:hypothetical protein